MKRKIIFAFIILCLITVLGCSGGSECDKGNHSLSEVKIENKEESTCLKEGHYDEVIYCLDCGEEISRNHIDLEKTNHQEDEPVKENVAENTYDIVIYCKVCREELARETHNINSGECSHEPGTAVIQNEENSSCLVGKSYDEVIFCNLCHEELLRTRVTLDAPGHTDGPIEIQNEVFGTCQVGRIFEEVTFCAVCREEIKREFKQEEPTGHTPGVIVYQNEDVGTCLVGRSYDLVTLCLHCNEEMSREFIREEAVGHIFGREEMQNHISATCTTEESYDLVKFCVYCNEEMERENYKGEKAPHVYGDVIEENRIPSTCTVAGSYDLVRYCVVCHEELERTAIPLSIQLHEYEVVEENRIEATPQQEGSYDMVTQCKFCLYELSRDTHSIPITNQLYYSQFDYLELSKNINALDGLRQVTENEYELNTITHDGKPIRLYIIGKIEKDENGWAKIYNGTKIYALDSMFGINYLDVKYSDDSSHLAFLYHYYNLDRKTSVDSYEELIYSIGSHIGTTRDYEMDELPNYFAIETYEDIVLEGIKIYYNNVESIISELAFNVDFTQPYVPGELYNEELESNAINFYLIAKYHNSAARNENNGAFEGYGIYSIPVGDFEVGSIIDINGQKHERIGRRIQKGDKLEVTVSGFTDELECSIDTYYNKYLYNSVTTQYINSIGTQNVLAIPVIFKDHHDRYNETMIETIKKSFGNIIEKDGTIKTYSFNDSNDLSLSEKYHKSSYGKITLNTYITDPYYMDANGRDYYNNDWEQYFIEITLSEWLHKQNIELEKFDQNNDGYLDSVVLLPSVDFSDGDGGYFRTGISGSYKRAYGYTDEKAGTHEKPTIHTFVNLPFSFIFESSYVGDYKTNPTTDVLVHEFGHYFGLADYYDNESSYNVVGIYDIMSNNKGDMNSYSKYALGWTNPVVIDGKEDSYEIKINMFSTTGDSIVIPALGYDFNGTALDEYIIIDLFAHDGLYETTAREHGLENTIGVRIYHINSVYEHRTYEKKDGTIGDIATIHHSASILSKYSNKGMFLLELIQNGNVNTFTQGASSTTVKDSDFFKQGDSFRVDEYTNFFHQGKMDNGMDFGYEIKVKEIASNEDGYYAVIQINKIN